MDEGNNNNTEVFVYTEGVVVPEDVVRVRVHPSVTIIPERAFKDRSKLEEVELCEGLLERGKCAFHSCISLKRINIPSTVTKVHPATFQWCDTLEEVELCDGLLEIENAAFQYCKSLKQISVPSTVTQIQNRAFSDCKQLEELELFDGLQTIGNEAFVHCNLLKRLRIPNTVRSIESLAFCHAYQLRHLRLPEGIESIGAFTFSHNRCTTCRVPPSFTTITSHFIGNCKSMFSIELSEDVTDIERAALYESHSLRNVAFPQNAQVEEREDEESEDEESEDVLEGCSDLQQLYGTDEQTTNALKHRFDNLPIHKMIYYQSYNNVTVDQLNNATDIRISQRRSKLDPTGSQQDCLGMTPLHIIACSTAQSIELYEVLVDKYPENLITEDRWGAIPLLYAVWGDVPMEIVQFLVESYQSIPSYELNWTKLVEQLCLGNAATFSIQRLMDVQQDFSDQTIDWNAIIQKAATKDKPVVQADVFSFLVKCSCSKRVDAIGIKQWREDLTSEIENLMLIETGSIDKPMRCSISSDLPKRQRWLICFSIKLSRYEARYQQLKEATTLLELTLWRNNMDENSQERKECRINCGAHIVIEHVLPYLL